MDSKRGSFRVISGLSVIHQLTTAEFPEADFWTALVRSGAGKDKLPMAWDPAQSRKSQTISACW
jgi:hypothetical protein